FFLLSVYYLTKVLVKNGLLASQIQKSIVLSIVFANLSMYTHERYIVLFPFIFLTVLLFPNLKTLSLKQKISLGLAAVASLALNIIIKKYVYTMPFFMGTGGTNISFSFH